MVHVCWFLHCMCVSLTAFLQHFCLQIDKAVLTLMTDEQLARYIPTYGDRLAVVSFCHQQRHTPNRVTLLERIREKIGDRKMLKTDCHSHQNCIDCLESATEVEKRWYGRLKLGGFTIHLTNTSLHPGENEAWWWD